MFRFLAHWTPIKIIQPHKTRETVEQNRLPPSRGPTIAKSDHCALLSGCYFTFPFQNWQHGGSILNGVVGSIDDARPAFEIEMNTLSWNTGTHSADGRNVLPFRFLFWPRSSFIFKHPTRHSGSSLLPHKPHPSYHRIFSTNSNAFSMHFSTHVEFEQHRNQSIHLISKTGRRVLVRYQWFHFVALEFILSFG